MRKLNVSSSETICVSRPKGIFKIYYTHNEQKFSQLIRIPHGPTQFDLLLVSKRQSDDEETSGHDDDLTDQLVQYFGPKGDISSLLNLNVTFCDLIDVASEDILDVVTGTDSFVLRGKDPVSLISPKTHLSQQ